MLCVNCIFKQFSFFDYISSFNLNIHKMMRVFTLFFLALLLQPFSSFSQIKMDKGKYPFKQIVEWPGKGTLFMADDPTGKTKEKNISLFKPDGQLGWNKSIYPKVKNTHLILSNNSRYIYFVDDLKLYNDRDIRYNQVNMSGSIVHTQLSMLSIIKKYGYSMPDKLKLREIVNTPKALVLYFQLPNDDKGVVENIFVTITHHNNRVYSLKGPPTSMELLKEGKAYPFYFAGATASTICFSRFTTSHQKQQVQYALFSPKAEAQIGHTYGISSLSPIASAILPFSYTGGYYLNKENKSPFHAKGKGFYLEGHFYYAVNDAKDRCLKIYGVNNAGKFVVLYTSKRVAPEKKKYKDASLSFLPLGKQIIVMSDINDTKSAVEIHLDKIQPFQLQGISFSKLQKNPSSFQLKDKTSKFVHFINEQPYFINPSELGNTKEIIFKQ